MGYPKTLHAKHELMKHKSLFPLPVISQLQNQNAQFIEIIAEISQKLFQDENHSHIQRK